MAHACEWRPCHPKQLGAVERRTEVAQQAEGGEGGAKRTSPSPRGAASARRGGARRGGAPRHSAAAAAAAAAAARRVATAMALTRRCEVIHDLMIKTQLHGTLARLRTDVRALLRGAACRKEVTLRYLQNPTAGAALPYK